MSNEKDFADLKIAEDFVRDAKMNLAAGETLKAREDIRVARSYLDGVAVRHGGIVNQAPIEKALMVLVLDPKIRAWLQANDPKAFEQATRALTAAGLKASPD